MSSEHGTIDQPDDQPIILGVRQADTAVMFEREAAKDSSAYDWFMATAVFVDGSKNPSRKEKMKASIKSFYFRSSSFSSHPLPCDYFQRLAFIKTLITRYAGIIR